MSVFTRMARGCHLGIRSLIIVFRDKTLLVFPLIPFTCVIAIASTFWLIVGSDQLLWGILATHMVEARNILVAYVVYLLIGLVSVFFGVGLVTCTRITLEERDSKFLDGFRNAIRNLHWITIWTFISWTIGPFLNLLDHLRHTTHWVRRILKTSWSMISYFVIPILVVDRVNVFSALHRSVEVMTRTWGAGAVSRLGLYWFFLMLNIPTVGLVALGHYPEGPWPPFLTLVVLLYIYGTIVVYQTASSVLSVVLYKYASDGSVVPGFKEEHLKGAFVRPKVYVLVTDAPNAVQTPVTATAIPVDAVTVSSLEDVTNVTSPPVGDVQEAAVSDAPPATAESAEIEPEAATKPEAEDAEKPS